jgi:sulfoquinovosyltransferase
MTARPALRVNARPAREPAVLAAVSRAVVPGAVRARQRSAFIHTRASVRRSRLLGASLAAGGDTRESPMAFSSHDTGGSSSSSVDEPAAGSELASTKRVPRKVCVFVEPSPFSHVSGMKNRFLRLIENLVELGDEVVVVTPDRNPPPTYAGATVIGVHGFKLPFYPGDTLLLSYAFDKKVRTMFADESRRPDLIHCSSPGALIWTACHLSEKYAVPLVQSYHTHIPHYIPQYTWAGLVKPMWDCIRIWTGRADLTMVTSSILKDELKGENCPRLEVWQKGVDTVTFNPKFRTEEMHARLCGGRPGKVIGCVGRLGAEKNLKALRTILEYLPEGTNLALIGDGPERASLEKHFEGTNTTFMGMMLGDDLAAAYASLDVFVMPSESETLGFVVMEAMASGVPVVAVRAGGLQDILTNTPEVGQLYPSQDYEEAARLTAELLTDENEWTSQRESCRDAVEEWSWMASNKKLRDAQYAMALRRFKRNRRIRVFLELVKTRRKIATLAKTVLTAQWFLQFGAYALALGALLGARALLGGGAAADLAGAATGSAGVFENGFGSVLAGARTVAGAAGAFGPAAMATIVAVASVVPFVPTQPFYVLSGALFGAQEGAMVALLGSLEAAAVAFLFARQLGRRRVADALADPQWLGPKFGAPARRLVRETLADAERAFLGSTSETAGGGVTGDDAIGKTNGTKTPLEKFLKLTLYRLAPHAPFTVANYVLGLSDESKLSFKLFVGSTLAGIAPWCVFYALVGAASGAAAGGAGAAAASSAAQTARLVASGADLLVALALAAVLTLQPVRAWKAMKAFGEEAKRKSLAA